MRLFDAHCHLHDDALAPRLGEHLAEARAVGVVGWAVCGTAEADWDGVKDGLVCPDVQERALRSQATLARDLGRPLSVHGARAWGRVLEMLRPLGPFPAGVICHAFAGAPELVAPLVALGASFSFCATITRHRAGRVHAAARAVPVSRLLVETDAPDLPPIGAEPVDGVRLNPPRNLRVVLETLAALRGEDPVALAEETARNAEVLFPAGRRP